MTILRLGAVAAALVLTGYAASADAATYNVNCSSGAVTGAASASATPTTVLGIVLGTSSALPTISPAPVSGDIIRITSRCLQDVAVTTSGLTITNDSGPGSGFISSDGIEGQLELVGATGIVIDGLLLGNASSFSFASPKDVAVLYAHDGAAASVTSAEIENSPLLGVLAARSAKVELTSTTVSANGGGVPSDTLERDNGGIQARDNGSVVIGASDGSGSVTVSSHSTDAAAAYRNSSIIVYSANFTGNTAHQILALSASAVHITLASSTINAASGASNAVQAVGTSTLQIDAGAVVTGASGSEAISLTGGSALLLQGSNISAPGAGPVIEASSGSVIALAGGNNICSGTLSGATCTPASGTALEIDHVASLVQISGADFGYTAAVENVTGAGIAVLQSTIDLGLGTISTNPSLSWTTGSNGISVAQNSSVRLQGGVTITGTLSIGQGSNGFFNKTKGGVNAVTQVVCPFTTVPAAHIVAGSAGSPTVSPFPNPSTNFLATSQAAKQCLTF